MKIYATCLIKNEADIIGQTLTYAAGYCDKIFVVDNGSTDGTWEIVQGLSKQHSQVEPFIQIMEPFHNGLRWFPYIAHHRQLTDLDWWMILDGDEFLMEDPRPVIQRATKEGADIIRVWQIQFYYTEKDHETWIAGQDSRETPIFERRRFYRIDWQEPRFFRNEPSVSWEHSFLSRTVPVPASLLRAKSDANHQVPQRRRGKVFRRLMLNRHYQYRDPLQIEQRLLLRMSAPTGFRHVKSVGSVDWRSVMRSSRGLTYHEDGRPWRFSYAGLLHCYAGRIQYTLRRYLRAASKLVAIDRATRRETS